MATKITAVCALPLLSLLVVMQANAQTLVSGRITGNNGRAVPSASVKLNGTAEGDISDSLGRFSFSASATGQHVLTVTSIGYAPYSQPVNIQGKNLALNIILKKKENKLEGIIVNAGGFLASDKAKGAELTSMDLFTVAGNNADIALGLRSLPGTQQIGEQSGLFVRGGTDEETKQFIDGMLMPFPNYNNVPGVLQPARINPILFKGILFSAGGYSALYGEAMSSALILNSIDFPDQSSFNFNIFPPHEGIGFQKIAKNKKGSYGINLNYSNQSFLYNNIVPQKLNYTYGPEYLEGDANLRKKIGKTGMLKWYVNWGKSHIGLRSADIDSIQLESGYGLKSQNIYTHITYRQYLHNNWEISAGLAYDHNRENTRLQLLDADHKIVQIAYKPFTYKNDQKNIYSDFAQGRVVLARFFPHNQSLQIGAEHFYTLDKFERHDSATVLKDHLSAVFAEGNTQISPNIAIRLGGRLEYSSLLKETSFSPRVSLAYQFQKGTQLNLAYGLFYQKPGNNMLCYNQHLGFSRATHYMLTFTHQANNRFFRAAAYYKKYHGLIKTIPALSNSGEGYAKGFELFWRDKKLLNNLDYWVSYTYLDSKRSYLNFPYSLRPPFSARHTATIAVKEFIPAISTFINVSYAFSSGRSYYHLSDETSGDAVTILDHGQTKAYSVTNLHIAYLFHMFKKWKKPTFTGAALGVNNLFGTRQVFGYNYSHDGTNKVPVTLPAPRYFYLGFWFSLGVDQTENILDNM